MQETEKFEAGSPSDSAVTNYDAMSKIYLDVDPLEKSKVHRVLVCGALLFFTVSSTLCTQASKSTDGSYAYNTFVIPFVAESLKFFISIGLELVYGSKEAEFDVQRFLRFSIPASCYFISNNCMFYIIKELGGVTFQVTNNLKIISTGLLMQLFLRRRLRWSQWKSLVILAVGCAVTQLKVCDFSDTRLSVDRNAMERGFGYAMILMNAFASGAGGVISEILLKGSRQQVSIHRQNAQLYFFGAAFGIVAIRQNSSFESMYVRNEYSYSIISIFDGFNLFAYAAILSLAASGLFVSIVLKYMDNFVKCFVAAVSMLLVAMCDMLIWNEPPTLQFFLGVTLTCIALEQYYFSYES